MMQLIKEIFLIKTYSFTENDRSIYDWKYSFN